MRWTYTAGRYYAGWGHKRNFKKKEEKGRKNLSGWRHRRSAASRPGSAPVEGTSRTLLCNSNVVVYPRQLMSRAHRRRHRTQHEDPALSLSLTRSTINLNNPSSPSLSLSLSLQRAAGPKWCAGDRQRKKGLNVSINKFKRVPSIRYYVTYQCVRETQQT